MINSNGHEFPPVRKGEVVTIGNGFRFRYVVCVKCGLTAAERTRGEMVEYGQPLDPCLGSSKE